jgi:hypothetical protein
MPDHGRRTAILERSKALRERATAFNDRLKDERAKEFMRTSVFNSLDDVDKFFLGDAKTRPSMEIWERMWLDSAEMILSTAEQSFSKFEDQVKQYGGPEKVRMFG